MTKALELAEMRQREQLAEQLMTKVDAAHLKTDLMLRMEEIRTELVRWMFLLWTGLVPVIALLIKYVK